MNLTQGEASDAFFGGDAPPVARSLLHRAAGARPDERTALLWTAQALAPGCLAVYHALYKHHATRRELALAERAATRGLLEAGRQARIDIFGRSLDGGGPVDFHGTGAARFWLFTQKALAFLALRAGRTAEARERLTRIVALEPDARLGEDVIARLLAEAGDPRDTDR